MAIDVNEPGWTSQRVTRSDATQYVAASADQEPEPEPGPALVHTDDRANHPDCTDCQALLAQQPGTDGHAR